jgi:hypothetical protein
VTFGSQLGFRYDRSAESVSNPDRLSRADRMSLGVSDTNAVLLGAGIVARAAKNVELLGEWTWDVRVPSKGASAAQSPMRIDVGGRYLASETMALELVVEASPSSRPPVGPGTPLAVIEPRVSVFAGINIRPSLPTVETPPPPPVTTPEKPAEVASVGRLEGRVTDDGGRPIVGAKVHAVPQAAPSNTTGKADAGADAKTNDYGTFELTGLPVGKTELTVSAEGYRDSVRIVDVTAAKAQSLEIQLERALPQGQIRGLARSFAGQPIKGATVRIEPIGKELQVGEGGRFEVDVPPGEYDVIVKATGYADQQRHVRVEANGVVVLDLDLRTRR